MTAIQPAERRRLQSRAEARRAILDATEALLVEDGATAFSMRRLAERCGYTPPTIYHYFGDKQRLLDELLDERCRTLVRSLRRVGLDGDPVRDLRALSVAFARFGLRNPTHYALLAAPRDPELPPPPAAEEARVLLSQPIDQLAAESRLCVDVEAARQSFWAFLHGLILLRTTRPDLEWAKDVLEVGLDALIRGLVRGGAGDPA
ncbi:MAG TPA: TetR/AcrR family transcriptional regulator [Myxococcota bacterium]|nr:TetR/AcrR family transcriptional regulator [Myxococcota bacterium]